MTTLEIIDLVEARLGGLRPKPVAADLRAELDSSGLTPCEVAQILNLPLSSIEDWLDGRTPVPLLTITIQLLQQLSRAAQPAPEPLHPFARIEDL